MLSEEVAEITPAGTRFLTAFGDCLDWTDRRPHIAGAAGAALTKRHSDPGWTQRIKHRGAVIVTASGKYGFLNAFGIGMPEETGNGIGGQ